MADDLILRVEGREYAGWKGVTVTRSIESIAGSFEVSIHDVWAGSTKPWPIIEEDECEVEIDGQVVLTGWVDKVSRSIEGSTRTFKVTGRDKAAALADCSAVLDKWVFRKTPLLDLAKKLCEPFAIDVALQPGLVLALPATERLTINPGDTAHAALEQACRMTGVLAFSDGKGGVVLARAGATERSATRLELGVNLLKVSAEFDYAKRFHKYKVLSSNASKIPKSEPDKKGNAGKIARLVRVSAEAFDDEVRRLERIKLINPEKGADKKYAQSRADYEAKVRASRGDTVHATVHGWTQPNNFKIWPINALCDIEASAVGVSGEMLITETKFSLDSSGRIAELTLKRPDAFTPEPRIKKKGGDWWKELAGGV